MTWKTATSTFDTSGYYAFHIIGSFTGWSFGNAAYIGIR